LRFFNYSICNQKPRKTFEILVGSTNVDYGGGCHSVKAGGDEYRNPGSSRLLGFYYIKK